MYLSRLTLHPRNRDARRDAASPYNMHRTIARAFSTPEGIDYRAYHKVLFRFEPHSYSEKGPVVLVQSETAPDWHGLPKDYFLDFQTRSFDFSFTDGQSFAFRLVANPTRKVKRPGYKQGRRVGIPDTPTEQGSSPVLDWLHGKGRQHGFEVNFAVVNPFILGNAASSNNKGDLPLWGARFDGLLRITNTEQFKDALQKGIGTAKAFGFGLLSLAKQS